MKHDLDLIKRKLLKIESEISYSKLQENFQIDEFNAKEII